MNTTTPDPAVIRNTEALRRILATIFTYIGLADDTRHAMRMFASGRDAQARAFELLCDPFTIPRRVHRMIRAYLLPAESATRRLIVALAAELPNPKLRPSEIKRLAKRATPPDLTIIRLKRSWEPGVMVPRFIFNPPKPPPGPPKRMPRFCLFDTLKRFDRRRYAPRRSQPSIRTMDSEPRRVPLYVPQTERDPIPDRYLMRRVAALTAALDDLPRQARRLAKWRALRDALAHAKSRSRRYVRTSPLRPGMAPGSPPTRLPKNEYDDQHTVLGECSSLAWWAEDKRLRSPDTS